jgi:ketosteroid isomerase-like protein
MPFELSDVIDEASFEDRILLASLLNTTGSNAGQLRERLSSKSRTLWQKVAGSEINYSDLLLKVADAHSMRRIVFENPRDFERRIVRTFFYRIRRELNPLQNKAYLLAMKNGLRGKLNFKGEAAGATSIVAAQLSGFGVYQMATTVTGMASSAAGITVPFIGYMALTKGISIVIGPPGWAALGAYTLHKITKPRYSEMVAVVAWMFLVRAQTSSQISIGNFSLSELTRKFFKIVLPIGLAIALFITADSPRNGPLGSNSTPVTTASQAEQQSQGASASTSPEPNQIEPLRRQAEDQIGPTMTTEQSVVVEQQTNDTQSESSEIAGTLSSWASAQAQNDAAKTADFYAEQVDRYFLKREVTREFVQADRQAFLDGGKRIQDYSIGELRFETNSRTTATVVLTKSWAILDLGGTAATQSSTRSRLWLKRTAEGWKINGEQDLKSAKE